MSLQMTNQYRHYFRVHLTLYTDLATRAPRSIFDLPIPEPLRLVVLRVKDVVSVTRATFRHRMRVNYRDQSTLVSLPIINRTLSGELMRVRRTINREYVICVLPMALQSRDAVYSNEWRLLHVSQLTCSKNKKCGRWRLYPEAEASVSEIV